MKRLMTQHGYDQLRSELQRLKAMRPEIARQIEVARALGDISENGDYDAAKEKSGMTEAKIRDIESRLSHAQVVDLSSLPEPTKVSFGVTVLVAEVSSGDERTMTILGAEEAQVERGIISYESPLGRALIGKEVGDIARIELPGGTKEYEILELSIRAVTNS